MKKIIIFVFGALILGIMYYSFQGGRSQEAYKASIKEAREQNQKFMQNADDSPFTSGIPFNGLNYYPPDPDYKVHARMIPFEQTTTMEIPMTDGSLEKYQRYGHVEFKLKGEKHRLLVLKSTDQTSDRELFLFFADGTSGNTTYGGGRYLNLETRGQNQFQMDFNKAYNPYCAYNPDYNCPIPPKQNRLDIKIKAGEKKYEKAG